ncbi:hypothetical protein F4780DRAFT_491712 [Xylariomycetidae sp. FL0641]|nr:hypothetical protein F4780DRAFT_491712 [Xylariomycetidae sp. FL0641]
MACGKRCPGTVPRCVPRPGYVGRGCPGASMCPSIWHGGRGYPDRLLLLHQRGDQAQDKSSKQASCRGEAVGSSLHVRTLWHAAAGAPWREAGSSRCRRAPGTWLCTAAGAMLPLPTSRRARAPRTWLLAGGGSWTYPGTGGPAGRFPITGTGGANVLRRLITTTVISAHHLHRVPAPPSICSPEESPADKAPKEYRPRPAAPKEPTAGRRASPTVLASAAWCGRRSHLSMEAVDGRPR